MAKVFRALKATQYCYFFDLQAGIVVISLIGFTVMIMSIIINLGVENVLRDKKIALIQTCAIMAYLALGLISFIILFVSANKEKKVLVIISFILISIIFVLWAGFLSLSYFESWYRYSCIYDRCPDLHWIMSARWRNAQIGMCQRVGKWRSLKEPIILTQLYSNSTEISVDQYETEQYFYNNISININNTNRVNNFHKIQTESDYVSANFNKDNVFKNGNNVTYENDMTVFKQNENFKYLNGNIVHFHLNEPGADVGKRHFFIASTVIASCWGVFMVYSIYTIFMYYLELKNVQQNTTETTD